MTENAYESVRRYYDHNTAAFEKFGQGATTIHRAVWGDGVTTREGAFAYLDGLVAQEIMATESSAGARVLDLGCGLGASSIRLAQRFDKLEAVGVTLSPVQVARASQLIAAAGLATRVSAQEADFLHLPPTLGQFDVAFAIESFVHCPDPAEFFQSLKKHVRRGGRLVICDDFLRRPAATPREARWVRDIQHGWMGYGLAGVDATLAHAERAGFFPIRDTNLTPQLELRRFRDTMMTILLTLGRPFGIRGTRWGSWVGGDALQWALVHGLVEYHYLVLEHRPASR